MTVKACTPASAATEGRLAGTNFLIGAKAPRGRQYLGNSEPALEDLLRDDVLVRLMARDGVLADQVRQLASHIPV